MLDGAYREDGGAPQGATSSHSRTLSDATRADSQQTHRHHFEAFRVQDNARLHARDVYSGQHTHYHEAPYSHPRPKEISLLEALAFEQMDFRSATIAPAHAKTCDWLFSAPP